MQKSLKSSLILIVSGLFLPVIPPDVWQDSIQSIGPAVIEGIHLFRDLWRMLPQPEQQLASAIQSLLYLSGV